MSAANACRRLVGKVAVVTASTDGIGLSIAKRLGLEGAKVVVSSRRQENVDRTVEELKKKDIDVYGLVCHASKREDRENLFKKAEERYGGVDILVSNAATNPTFHPILDTEEKTWDKVFDVNVKATFFLIKECVPYMEKRGGGAIVVVSSIAGYQPSNMLGAYSLSKTTLLGLTKVLVPELSARNIRINGLCPGLIKTRFSSAIWKNDSVAELSKENIPMHRIGMPDECGGITAFMVSDDASYMTGENIVVAGGQNARL